MQNDHQDNLDTYMRLMGVKWHKTYELIYSKSRLKREIEKTSIRNNINEYDSPSDGMSDLVEWMKNEREKKKPLCHFFLSDIRRKFLSHAEEHSDSNSTPTAHINAKKAVNFEATIIKAIYLFLKTFLDPQKGGGSASETSGLVMNEYLCHIYKYVP